MIIHWHVGYFNTRDNKFVFISLFFHYVHNKKTNSVNIKNLEISYSSDVSLYFKIQYNSPSIKHLIKATGTLCKFNRNMTKNLINTMSLYICN